MIRQALRFLIRRLSLQLLQCIIVCSHRRQRGEVVLTVDSCDTVREIKLQVSAAVVCLENVLSTTGCHFTTVFTVVCLSDSDDDFGKNGNITISTSLSS